MNIEHFTHLLLPTRLLLPGLLGLTLVGCSTINFVQYEQPGEHKTVHRWHHTTLNGMVEVSKPLDIRTICQNRAWTKITTEHTVYNWLAEIAIPKPGGVLLYSAWTNKVQCHEPPAGG